MSLADKASETQSSRVHDEKDPAIAASVRDLTNANPLDVAIVDATGNQVTSFGGGTQYTEGDTDASITGMAALMEGAADTLLPIQGTLVDGLLVNLGTNNDITVASLPLPSGAATETTLSDILTELTQKTEPANTQLVDVTDEPTRDLGKVDVASLDQYTPVSGRLPVDGSGVIQPVSAASLPLPAGAATSAAQLPNSHDVTIDNAAGAAAVNIQDGGNAITVDGTVAVSSGGGGVQYTEGDADASITGNAILWETAGNILTPVSVGAPLPVNLISSTPSIKVAGILDDDAPETGIFPVIVGGHAKSPDGTTPGTVSAEDDVARFITDLNRRQYVNPVSPWLWSYHEDSSSALTDASVQADPGDGFSIYVTDIIVSTGAATALNIFFEEGATKVLGPYYLEAVAGRGLAIHFVTPKKITASTALTVTTSAAIAHSIDVMGFIANV